MMTLRKVTACLCLVALLLGPAVRAQEAAPPSADVLREQIGRLEAIRLEGKSASVQIIHQRALLRLYDQLAAALRQDAEALKEIQAAIGAEGAEAREVNAQLLALEQEQAKLADKAQRLKADLRASVAADRPVAAAATRSARAEEVAHTADPPAAEQPGGAPSFAPAAAPPPASRPRVSSRPEAAAPPASRAAVSGGLFSGSAPAAPAAQDTKADIEEDDPTDDFNDALNKAIDRVVAARINKRSDSKQIEPASISDAAASLVDRSEAGDLVNVALNLAGLSATTAEAEQPDNVTVTASAYSLLAAFRQVDPLNPSFYNRNKEWRRLSFTLGYDDEGEGEDGAEAERARIFGVKYLIVNKRDATALRHSRARGGGRGGPLQTISSNLLAATRRFGAINDRVQGFLISNPTLRQQIIIPQFTDFLALRIERQERLVLEATAADTKARHEAELATLRDLQGRLKEERVLLVGPDGLVPSFPRGSTDPRAWTAAEQEYFSDFLNQYLGAGFRQKLGPEVVAQLEEFIERELEDTRSFEDLNRAQRDALANILRAPQLSFYFLTKQRDEGMDEYMGEAIFDYGVADRVNLTLNSSFNYFDSREVGGDTRAARVAGQFQFRLTEQDLAGKRPIFFSVAGDGNWKSGADFIYRLQGKLLIPVADGLDLPLSVTYANRSELNDERTVRGQFGFSFDTARIFQAFLRR